MAAVRTWYFGNVATDVKVATSAAVCLTTTGYDESVVQFGRFIPTPTQTPILFLKRRERERAMREIENIRKKEAAELAANLKARGNLKVDIDVSSAVSSVLSVC